MPRLEERWIYTADDEKPNCMNCDHICGSQTRCDKCGPEYWWQYYERTEVKDYAENYKG